MKKKLTLVACLLVIALTFAGCASDKYQVFNKAISGYTIDTVVSYDYAKSQSVNNNVVYSKVAQLMNLGGEMTRIVTEKKLKAIDGSGEKYATSITKDYYKDGKHGVDTASGDIAWETGARDSVFEIKTIKLTLDKKKFESANITNNYGIDTLDATVASAHIAEWLGENSKATSLIIRLEVKNRQLIKYRMQYDVADGARVITTVMEYKINY